VGKPSKSPWLHREPARDVAARLFCIPQAGCGTSVFDRWPERWNSVELVPVELPGRLPRFGERIPSTFQALAAAMLDGLEPYLDVPFGFFGHCWSAIAAYETVDLAERTGYRPARLFVSSDLPPHSPRTGVMSGMTEEELAAEVAEAIRTLGGEPHPELMSIYVRILRDDMRVRETYVPSPPRRLGCQITVFGWEDDDEVEHDLLPTWSECGEAAVHVLPGGHDRFTDAPAQMLDIIAAGMGP
jgi:surfactin synthase thioesterase subunit